MNWCPHCILDFLMQQYYFSTNSLSRVGQLSDIRMIQGIWTAHETVMTDLRRSSTTRLSLDKVQYNLPLKDDNFTVQALRRQ